MPSRLPEVEAFKGLLISLIVLGHNTLFSRAYPEAFGALYNFHVACFLLLPCLFFGSSVQGFQLRTRLVRYGVPHLWFFGLACVLFFLIYRDISAPSALATLREATLALLFSTEGRYKSASGFGLFWFLPALLCLALLRSALYSGRRAVYIAIVLAGVAAQLFVGWIPQGWLPSLPFSLPLVLFLLPLGMAAGALWRRFGNRQGFYALSALVFAGCVIAGIAWNSGVALAGDPRVYSLSQPARLVFHDLYLLAAFFGLLGLARWLPPVLMRVFGYLGRHSLAIFLVHSFVWQALLRLGVDELMARVQGRPMLGILLAFGLTLGITCAVASLIARQPRVHALLFPRDAKQWRWAWTGKGASVS